MASAGCLDGKRFQNSPVAERWWLNTHITEENEPNSLVDLVLWVTESPRIHTLQLDIEDCYLYVEFEEPVREIGQENVQFEIPSLGRQTSVPTTILTSKPVLTRGASDRTGSSTSRDRRVKIDGDIVIKELVPGAWFLCFVPEEQELCSKGVAQANMQLSFRFRGTSGAATKLKLDCFPTSSTNKCLSTGFACLDSATDFASFEVVPFDSPTAYASLVTKLLALVAPLASVDCEVLFTKAAWIHGVFASVRNNKSFNTPNLFSSRTTSHMSDSEILCSALLGKDSHFSDPTVKQLLRWVLVGQLSLNKGLDATPSDQYWRVVNPPFGIMESDEIEQYVSNRSSLKLPLEMGFYIRIAQECLLGALDTECNVGREEDPCTLVQYESLECILWLSSLGVQPLAGSRLSNFLQVICSGNTSPNSSLLASDVSVLNSKLELVRNELKTFRRGRLVQTSAALVDFVTSIERLKWKAGVVVEQLATATQLRENQISAKVQTRLPDIFQVIGDCTSAVNEQLQNEVFPNLETTTVKEELLQLQVKETNQQLSNIFAVRDTVNKVVGFYGMQLSLGNQQDGCHQVLDSATQTVDVQKCISTDSENLISFAVKDNVDILQHMYDPDYIVEPIQTFAVDSFRGDIRDQHQQVLLAGKSLNGTTRKPLRFDAVCTKLQPTEIVLQRPRDIRVLANGSLAICDLNVLYIISEDFSSSIAIAGAKGRHFRSLCSVDELPRGSLVVGDASGLHLVSSSSLNSEYRVEPFLTENKDDSSSPCDSMTNVICCRASTDGKNIYCIENQKGRSVFKVLRLLQPLEGDGEELCQPKGTVETVRAFPNSKLRHFDVHPVSGALYFVDGSDAITILTLYNNKPPSVRIVRVNSQNEGGPPTYRYVTIFRNDMIGLVESRAMEIHFIATTQAQDYYENLSDSLLNEFEEVTIAQTLDCCNETKHQLQILIHKLTSLHEAVGDMNRIARNGFYSLKIPNLCKVLVDLDSYLELKQSARPTFKKLFKLLVEAAPHLHLVKQIANSLQQIIGKNGNNLVEQEYRQNLANYVKEYQWPREKNTLKMDVEFIIQSLQIQSDFSSQFWDETQLCFVFFNSTFMVELNAESVSIIASAVDFKRSSPRDGVLRSGVSKWIGRLTTPVQQSSSTHLERLVSSVNWLRTQVSKLKEDDEVFRKYSISSAKLEESIKWLSLVLLWRFAQEDQGATGARRFVRLAGQVLDQCHLNNPFESSMLERVIREAVLEVCADLSKGVLNLDNVLEMAMETSPGFFITLQSQEKSAVVSSMNLSRDEADSEVMVITSLVSASPTPEFAPVSVTAKGTINCPSPGVYCLVCRPHPSMRSYRWAVDGKGQIELESKSGKEGIIQSANGYAVALLDTTNGACMDFQFSLPLRPKQPGKVMAHELRKELIDVQLIGPIMQQSISQTMALAPAELLISHQKLNDVFTWNQTQLLQTNDWKMLVNFEQSEGKRTVALMSLARCIKELVAENLTKREYAFQMRLQKIERLEKAHPDRSYDKSPPQFETKLFSSPLEGAYATSFISNKSQTPWIRFLFAIVRLASGSQDPDNETVLSLQGVLVKMKSLCKSCQLPSWCEEVLEQAVSDCWLVCSRGQEQICSPDCPISVIKRVMNEIHIVEFCAKNIVHSDNISRERYVELWVECEDLTKQIEAMKNIFVDLLFPLGSFTDALSHLDSVCSRYQQLSVPQTKHFLEGLMSSIGGQFDLLKDIRKSSAFAEIVAIADSEINESEWDDTEGKQGTSEILEEDDIDGEKDVKLSFFGPDKQVRPLPDSGRIQSLLAQAFDESRTFVRELSNGSTSFGLLNKIGFFEFLEDKTVEEFQYLAMLQCLSGELDESAVESWVEMHSKVIADWRQYYSVLLNAFQVIENVTHATKLLADNNHAKKEKQDEELCALMAAVESLKDFTSDFQDPEDLKDSVNSLRLCDMKALSFCEAVHPVYVHLSNKIFGALPQCSEVFKFLRRTPNDSDFSSSLEIAFSSAEMDTPHELWNNELNCVDEAKLSAVSVTRSLFYPVIFAPDFPFPTGTALQEALYQSFRLVDSVHSLAQDQKDAEGEDSQQQEGLHFATVPSNALDELRVPIGTTEDDIVNDLNSCMMNLKPIMMLLMGGSSAGNVSNKLFVILKHKGCWTCQSANLNASLSMGQDSKHLVELYYTLKDSAGNDSVKKVISIDQLVDFQASLLLAADEYAGDVEYLNSLISTYCAELNWTVAVSEVATELWKSGHVGFRSFSYEFPFLEVHIPEEDGTPVLREPAVDPIAPRRFAKKLSSVLSEWKTINTTIREQFVSLNIWSIYQVGWLWDWLKERRQTSSMTEDQRHSLGSFLSTYFLLSTDPMHHTGTLEELLLASTPVRLEEMAATTRPEMRENASCVQILCQLGMVLDLFLQTVPSPPTHTFPKPAALESSVPQPDTLGSLRTSEFLQPGFHSVSVDNDEEIWDYAMTMLLEASTWPTLSTVIVCSSTTTTQEVEMFFRRWQLESKAGTRPCRLFMAIGIHSMPFEVQQAASARLFELLDHFDQKSSEDKARLASCVLLGHAVGSAIASASSKKTLREARMSGWSMAILQRIRCTLFPVPRVDLAAAVECRAAHIRVYTSARAGQGKSFQVRALASRLGMRTSYLRVNNCDGKLGLIKQLQHCTPPGNRTLLHIDISDTAMRKPLVLKYALFELLFEGGLKDTLSDAAYFVDPSKVFLAVELPSGPHTDQALQGELSFLAMLPSAALVCNERNFTKEEDLLRVGFPSGYRGGSAFPFSAFPHERLLYVCQALNILKRGGGGFPYEYDLKTYSNHPQLALPGSEECFRLLMEASGMTMKTVSLWCIWNFVNTLFVQIQSLHMPGCPVNAICAPDPMSGKATDSAMKAAMKAEVLNFIVRTAKEFGVQSVRVTESSRVYSCSLNGFEVQKRFNVQWHRTPFDVSNKPCFENSGFFLYYRSHSRTWVIDDVVAPQGAVYSESQGDSVDAVWSTSPSWSRHPSVEVTRMTNPAGYKSEAYRISGCLGQGGSMTSHENGVYLRQPPYDNINDMPHFILRKDGANRRHLFYSADSKCWKVAPVCTEDEGAFMISEDTALETSFWKAIGKDVHEKISCKFYYSKAVEVEDAGDEYLPSNLIGWNESNHECFLFSNENHVLAFLASKPLKLRASMHPALKEYLMENDIVVGEHFDQDGQGLQRMYEILGAITNVSRSTKSANALLGGKYSLTGDGLLKILAIFFRLKCRIPVLLLGECGCGKTMMIKYLASWLNAKLIVKDIHGGTTEEDIVKAFEEAELHVKKVLEQGGSQEDAQVFIFLDEVNTCGHLGAISEALFERSLNGVPISNSIFILGALNPHRFVKQLGNEEQEGLTLVAKGGGASGNIDPMANLVYRVHPIPHRYHDVVFDFGYLMPKEENLYISAMIGSTLAQRTPGLSSATLSTIETCIRYSQSFLRIEENENAAVSLRDVQRCLDLVDFFIKFTGSKKKRSATSKAKKSKVISIELQCATLAVLFVYYFRLSGENIRNRYLHSLAGQFGMNHPLRGSGAIKSILNGAQASFCKKVKVDEGIAMNQALAENIFVTIVCVLNRIPIFLCGKPGTSKTLAVQVMASNLRGDSSPKPFWRRFPRVHLFQYQCSPMSSADAIQRQFDIACRYQEHAKEQITVLLLDEVGLAEQSPDFPLKVLHAMLVRPPISIVGLSNWVLDRAKMNRAILLQRTEPNESEILLTGRHILAPESGQANPGSANWMSAIARAYHTIYSNQRAKGQREFFGMRDYYSLIKSLRLCMHQEGDCLPAELLTQAVCRNFGGKSKSLAEILHTFHTNVIDDVQTQVYDNHVWLMDTCHPIPDALELIRANLKDQSSRNLMVLSRNGLGLPLLVDCGLIQFDREQGAAQSAKETTVLVGSQFPDDKSSELFLVEQINAVKRAMANGQTIVLVNHGSIYEALYDVLNQRYVTMTNSDTGKITRMLRLAIGNKSQLCEVRDSFKVVIVVEESEAYQQLDLPLLNRFEKQQLLARDILVSNRSVMGCEALGFPPGSYSELRLVEEVSLWLTEMLSQDLSSMTLSAVFPGFHDGTIPTLVVSMRDQALDCVIQDAKLTRDEALSNATELNESKPESSWAQVLFLKAACSILSRTAAPIACVMSSQLGRLLAPRDSDSRDIHFGPKLENVMSHMVTRGESLAAITTNACIAKLSEEVKGSFAIKVSDHVEATIDPRVLELSSVSSEQQLRKTLDAFFTEPVEDSSFKTLFLTCDPLVTPQRMIDHARILCSHRMHVARQKWPRETLHSLVLVVVHTPPSLKSRTREYTVDYYRPWTVWAVDDVELPGRPLQDVGDELTSALLGSSPSALLADDGRLQEIVRKRFQRAMTACSPPQAASLEEVRRRGEQYWQLCRADTYPFLRVMITCIQAILSKYRHRGKSRQFLHVEMAVRGEVYSGTLRDSLLAALEELVVRSFANALAYMDTNGNCALALETRYSATWAALASCQTVVDPAGVAAGVVLTESPRCVIGSTGEVHFQSHFPWSWRLIEVLETKAVKEKTLDLAGNGGGEANEAAVRWEDANAFLESVVETRVGEHALSEVQSHGMIGVKDYTHDLVCTTGFRSSQSLQTDQQHRLTLAVIELSSRVMNLPVGVSNVHLHLWMNETRMSLLTNMLRILPNKDVDNVIRCVESMVDSTSTLDYGSSMDKILLAGCNIVLTWAMNHLLAHQNTTGFQFRAWDLSQRVMKGQHAVALVEKALVTLSPTSLAASCNDFDSDAFKVFRQASMTKTAVLLADILCKSDSVPYQVACRCLLEPLLPEWDIKKDLYVLGQLDVETVPQGAPGKEKPLASKLPAWTDTAQVNQRSVMAISSAHIRAILLRVPRSSRDEFLCMLVTEVILSRVFCPWMPLRWEYRSLQCTTDEGEELMLKQLLKLAQSGELHVRAERKQFIWGEQCHSLPLLPGVVFVRLQSAFTAEMVPLSGLGSLTDSTNQSRKPERFQQQQVTHNLHRIWNDAFQSSYRLKFSLIAVLEDLIRGSAGCEEEVMVSRLLAPVIEHVALREQLRSCAVIVSQKVLEAVEDGGACSTDLSNEDHEALQALYEDGSDALHRRAFVLMKIVEDYGVGFLYAMQNMRIENSPEMQSVTTDYLGWLPLSYAAKKRSRELESSRVGSEPGAVREALRSPATAIVLMVGTPALRNAAVMLNKLADGDLSVLGKGMGSILSDLRAEGMHHHADGKQAMRYSGSVSLETCWGCIRKLETIGAQAQLNTLTGMLLCACFLDLETEITLPMLQVQAIQLVQRTVQQLPSWIDTVVSSHGGAQFHVSHLHRVPSLLNGEFEHHVSRLLALPTPESKPCSAPKSFFRCVTLIVLGSLLHASDSWLMDLVMAPDRLKASYLPFLPRTSATALRMAMGWVGWYRCRNGHLYTVGECTMPMEVARCPSCGAKIGGEDHTPVRGTEKIDDDEVTSALSSSAEAGYILGSLHDITISGLSIGVASFGNFIVHVLLFWSSLCGNWLKVKKLLSSNLKAGKVPPRLDTKNDVQVAVLRIALDSWEAFHSSLPKTTKECSEDVMAMLVHSSLVEWGNRMSFADLQQSSARTRIEESGTRIFNTVLRYQNKLVRMLEKLGGSSIEVDTILNLDGAYVPFVFPNAKGITRSTLYDSTSIQWMFRTQVSLEDFQTFFNASTRGDEAASPSDHVFLREFLRVEDSLSKVRFAVDVLEWHRYLFRAFQSRRLSREEARTVTNEDAVALLPPELQDQAMSALDAYCTAFNASFPLVQFLYECQENPFVRLLDGKRVVDLSGRGSGTPVPMARATPVAFSLPYRGQGEVDACGLCTVQLLQVLQETHNRLVAQLGETAADGRQDRTARAPRVARFDLARRGAEEANRFVPRGEVRMASEANLKTSRVELEEMLVVYSRGNMLLPTLFAHSHESQETGKRVYAVDEIERSLERQVLSGKGQVRLITGHFAYMGDAKGSGSLARLATQLPQERLPGNLTAAIVREVDTVNRLRPILDVVEDAVTLLSQLRLASGEENRLFSQFVLDGLRMNPRDWELVTTPTISSWVKLKHLQHLYLSLEEMYFGNPLENVLSTYREDLEASIKEQLTTNTVKKKLLPCAALLRELMINQLCGEAAAANWPANASLSEYLGYSTELEIEDAEWFQIMEDLGVELRHTFEFFRFVTTMD